MGSTGQYKGSLAFNNVDDSKGESVNPNTGSLSFLTAVAALTGVRPSIDLKLNLFYREGFRGTFGLPKNWGLDLPYVLQNKSLTFSGGTFPIDAEWKDVENYRSGLRYVNNHGMRFEPKIPPGQLPSGLGTYGYTLKHPDGSVDFFDILGKPVEHHDIYGNFIHYNYGASQQQAPDSPELKLAWIRDSWGQEIKFTYQQGLQMRITLPNDSQATVRFAEQGVDYITDAEGRKTRFKYTPFNNSSPILSRVTHPNGLVSQYDYWPIKYKDINGNIGYMPAVKDHRQMDVKGNMYGRTQYVFGQNTKQDYTGLAIGCKMGGLTDSLMDDGAWAYRYDVTTARLDANGRVATKSCTWFNNLHLPVKTIQYAINHDNQSTEAIQTELAYMVDTTKRARITTYNLPIAVQQYRNVADEGVVSWEVMTRKEAQHNVYAKPVFESEYIGDVKQHTTNITYVKTECGLQLPSQIVKTDEILGTVDHQVNTPNPGGREIGFTQYSFKSDNKEGSQLRHHKNASYIYDDKGRLISISLAWSKDATVPDHSPASTTKTFAYTFRDGVLSRTETDAFGNRTVYQQDMRQLSGPIIKKTLAAGQTESFSHDRLGRVVKHTDAAGNHTLSSYLDTDSGTVQTLTTPLGYCTVTSYDVLNRESKQTDNGDPTKSSSGDATRSLSENFYESGLGLLERSLNRLGLATKFTYDSLGRPVTRTDAEDNITSWTYEKGGLVVNEFLNGESRLTTLNDPASRPVRHIKFPDSADKEISFLQVQETVYNGDGKITRKILSQMDRKANLSGTAKQLEIEDVEFGPNQSVAARTKTSFTDSGKDTVNRRFVLDLFDNKITYAKTTTYATGQSFKNQGAVYGTNANGGRSLYQNQKGQQETYEYDQNGWLIKVVRFSGAVISHQRDNLGRIIASKYPSTTKEIIYDADGRQIETREGADIVKNTFAIDGTLTGITYADGRSQKLTLDKYSRAISETDAFGVIKVTEYDPFGHVSRQTCQGDILTYLYGTANHAKHELLGHKFEGTREILSNLTYNGYGMLSQELITNSLSDKLLETAYFYDVKGKITTVRSSSSLNREHNSVKTYLYDGIGQVVHETVTDTNANTNSTTSYSYDGNSNVIAVKINGQESIMTYNSIDQRTDSGFQYDDDGRLTCDGNGQKYTFNDSDQLSSISIDSQPAIAYSYHSNDRLKERFEAKVERATFYHGLDRINAVNRTNASETTNNEQLSLFGDMSSMLAGYVNGKIDSLALRQLGSWVLYLGTGNYSSALYTAYGQKKPSKSPSTGVLSRFGFTQELTDCAAGLICMGSRFYNPKHFQFLTPDAIFTENRYAYCEGDPVNRIDPSGHSWQDWAGNSLFQTIVGAVVAATVTTLTTFGTSGTGAAVGAAAGGMAANLVVTFLQQQAGQRQGSFGEYAVEGGLGLLFGAISGGAGFAAKSFAGPNLYRAVGVTSLTSGTLDLARTSFTKAVHGEEFGFGEMAWAFVAGAGKGVATGYLARRAWLRDPTNGAFNNERIWGVSLASRSSSFLDDV